MRRMMVMRLRMILRRKMVMMLTMTTCGATIAVTMTVRGTVELEEGVDHLNSTMNGSEARRCTNLLGRTLLPAIFFPSIISHPSPP